MKKLMMLLTTFCAVGVSQAASVDWAIDLGKENYAEKQYYVFAGSKSADALALLAAYDATTTASALSDLALASGLLNKKAGKASGNGLDVGTETSLFMVVLNDALASGTTYISDTMDISGQVYTPPANSPGIFTAQSTNFTQSGTITGGGGGGGVPEPTSGLLLLVGGAMLALRRKQK